LGPSSSDRHINLTIREIRKVDPERAEQLPARISYLKNLAAENIKRFSNSREKTAIVPYVEANFVLGDEFALGLPISILNLISNGICISDSKSPHLWNFFSRFNVRKNEGKMIH
jgi:hypothetical protein